MQLDVVGEAHLADHVELALEMVDMLLLVAEDLGEQIAADIVANLLAHLDRATELLESAYDEHARRLAKLYAEIGLDAAT